MAEVTHRLDAYWWPYHNAMQFELDELYSEYGGVWHINCHSTRARGNPTDPDGESDRADFILGNRDGTTCNPAFMAVMEDFLKQRGYSVDINWPMKGMELVRRYGDPKKNRHSLQIELNRKLYMDESAISRNEAFAATRSLISDLNAEMADFVRAQN